MIEWQHGGRTDVDNLVMLCCAHHDQIHATEWTIDMSTGIPKFIPPPWTGRPVGADMTGAVPAMVEPPVLFKAPPE